MMRNDYNEPLEKFNTVETKSDENAKQVDHERVADLKSKKNELEDFEI